MYTYTHARTCTQPSSKPKDNYFCARSTSGQEGFHHHVEMAVTGDYTGLGLGLALIGYCVSRWNLSNSITHRRKCRVEMKVGGCFVGHIYAYDSLPHLFLSHPH